MPAGILCLVLSDDIERDHKQQTKPLLDDIVLRHSLARFTRPAPPHLCSYNWKFSGNLNAARPRRCTRCRLSEDSFTNESNVT